MTTTTTPPVSTPNLPIPAGANGGPGGLPPLQDPLVRIVNTGNGEVTVLYDSKGDGWNDANQDGDDKIFRGSEKDGGTFQVFAVGKQFGREMSGDPHEYSFDLSVDQLAQLAAESTKMWNNADNPTALTACNTAIDTAVAGAKKEIVQHFHADRVAFKWDDNTLIQIATATGPGGKWESGVGGAFLNVVELELGDGKTITMDFSGDKTVSATNTTGRDAQERIKDGDVAHAEGGVLATMNVEGEHDRYDGFEIDDGITVLTKDNTIDLSSAEKTKGAQHRFSEDIAKQDVDQWRDARRDILMPSATIQQTDALGLEDEDDLDQNRADRNFRSDATRFTVSRAE